MKRVLVVVAGSLAGVVLLAIAGCVLLQWRSS
jgi:hypothetical protein